MFKNTFFHCSNSSFRGNKKDERQRSYINLNSKRFTLGICPTFSFLFGLPLSKETPPRVLTLAFLFTGISGMPRLTGGPQCTQWVRLESLPNRTWLRDKVARSYVCLNFSVLFSLIQILNSFESCLIPQLSSSPPDVEAMRIYLILPECPLLQDSKYYITLTIPLAMAILRLDTNPSKVLGEFAKFYTCGFVLFILIGVTSGSWWFALQESICCHLISLTFNLLLFTVNF